MFSTEHQSNRLVNLIGIILILMAIVIAYLGKVVNVAKITAPFESLVQGTFVADWIDEAKQRDLERKLHNSDNPAQDIANFIKNQSGLSKAQQLYIKYQGVMERFENSISEIPNPFLIVICLWLLFALKSLVVLIPASFTCLVTALIFPFPVAVIINLCGYAIMFLAKYFWGKHIGEGGVSKLVKHSKLLWKYIQDEENGYGTGNPLVLFILRLVPTVPLNPISSMYGKMGYDLWKYMLLSMLGISLRVVSVTSIGSNVGNPFSSAFIVPLIVILFVSGFSMVMFSLILSRREKKEKAQEAAKETEEKEKKTNPKDTVIEQ
ncbi:MAG: TVP38/TMEM64 family protein [Clostridia bacterium]|nr:TVP38/TMEM64 family protein [Clostridia bacterium]